MRAPRLQHYGRKKWMNRPGAGSEWMEISHGTKNRFETGHS